MVEAHLGGVEDGLEAFDVTLRHEALQPLLARRVGKADAPRQIGDRHPAILREGFQDAVIKLVNFPQNFIIGRHFLFLDSKIW